MKNEINNLIVKKYGMDAGASVVGITASKDFCLAPDGFKPSDVLKGCQSVIVLGSPFSQEAFKNPVEYTKIRSTMLTKMTAIAKEVTKQIKANGYKAKAISASGGKYIKGEQFGHISLKHAAELAGLGLINRNYLLTNDQYGNLLWLSAVLTDADLIPDEKAQYTVCDNCNKCVEMCPAKALDDLDSFEKKECSGLSFKMVNRKLQLDCFLCRKVCPYSFGEKTENAEKIGNNK